MDTRQMSMAPRWMSVDTREMAVAGRYQAMATGRLSVAGSILSMAGKPLSVALRRMAKALGLMAVATRPLANAPHAGHRMHRYPPRFPGESDKRLSSSPIPGFHPLADPWRAIYNSPSTNDASARIFVVG
uniref:Uncharacterized protein n=1 Tax=Candidatus Kentrum sp. UNK TaxID=2126344 RepID=A0A451ASW8_9GAMM|nr:MAG: hypothetical protein BECKUNK1418G_GA0071005_13161 [Candidatus Kentron sp. UNK]VFK73820.1 MAG: hypothetical protein BECKUNK1418H_GA0071006_13061 [Candidatus Kentron sp. UNK]